MTRMHSAMSTTSRRAAILVALAVLATLLSRLLLADHSLWFDELASVFFAEQPLSRLWSGWMVRETNPPLYYTLLHWWIAAFGDGDISVRIPSIVCGALACLLAARLAWRVYGPRAAVAVALLVGLSGQHLYFALQARGYMLIFCLATLAIEATLQVAERLGEAPRHRALAGYTVCAILCVYLHTTMLLFPVVATAAVVLSRPALVRQRPSVLLPLLVADLIVLAASLWWMGITLDQLRVAHSNVATIPTVSPKELVKQSVGLALGRNVDHERSGFVVLGLIALLALSFVARDRARFETRFLAILLVVGGLLFALLGLKAPIYTARTVFWLSLIPLLFAGAALAKLKGMWPATAAAGAVALVMAINLAINIHAIQPEDWNGAIRRAAAGRGVPLVVMSESMGINAALACRRVYGRCPMPIIALTDPRDTADSWANGLYAGPTTPLLAAWRLPTPKLYLFRKQAFHNPIRELHDLGRGQGIDDPEDSYFTGPIRPTLLR